MSDATIPGGQTTYAGDEEVVCKQVVKAMAEAAPMPTWNYSEKPTEPVNIEQRERVALTNRTRVEAWAYNMDHWICSLEVRITSIDSPQLTAADRLAILREALAEIDAARPVLVRLIEAAEMAGG